MFEWILVLVMNHNGWEEQMTYNEVFTTPGACEFRRAQIEYRTLVRTDVDLVMAECKEHIRDGVLHK